MLQFARRALRGVGSPELGEWEELGDRAAHVRRRLSSREEAVTGPVVDIRGSQEATERLAVVPGLPAWWKE